MSAAQYARLVPRKFRGPKLPKTDRKMRPRVLAWAGPAAFYPNRFYEIDKWYKARIDKPNYVPDLHIVDPSLYTKSLADLMSEENSPPVDIGFTKREAKKISKIDSESELEKASRNKKLNIDMSRVEVADWRIAMHFGVFEHIFGHNVFFNRTQDFEVSFGDNAVHNGNVLWAADTENAPEVKLECVGKSGYNTIVVVNLDGNVIEDKCGEIVHWMVANIPDGGKVEDGEEKATWMQSLPFMGTGYNRLVFLLLRHSHKIDVPSFSDGLSSRVFSTAQFYMEQEENVTPSCLLFSNVLYDVSVKKQLHSEGTECPAFDYQWSDALKRPQKEFPLKPMSFDLYLDQFRDSKEVQADIVRERLQRFGLSESVPPRVLDDNYAENKMKLEPWRHSRILESNNRDSPLYNNCLKQ